MSEIVFFGHWDLGFDSDFAFRISDFIRPAFFAKAGLKFITAKLQLVQNLARIRGDLRNIVVGQLPGGKGMVHFNAALVPHQHRHGGVLGNLISGWAGVAVEDRQGDILDPLVGGGRPSERSRERLFRRNTQPVRRYGL